MPRDTPRGFQLIRTAIADVDDVVELTKLRDLAREQWGEDPRHSELEALLDARAGELAGTPGTQIPLPLATIPVADPAERMMDEIAAAESVAEVEWLRKRARRDFAGHARMGDIEIAADGRLLALARRS
jgi:hypothetical protein